jgi:hypothetical protein
LQHLLHWMGCIHHRQRCIYKHLRESSMAGRNLDMYWRKTREPENALSQRRTHTHQEMHMRYRWAGESSRMAARSIRWSNLLTVQYQRHLLPVMCSEEYEGSVSDFSCLRYGTWYNIIKRLCVFEERKKVLTLAGTFTTVMFVMLFHDGHTANTSW